MNLLIDSCFPSAVPLLSRGWIVPVGGATPDRLKMGARRKNLTFRRDGVIIRAMKLRIVTAVLVLLAAFVPALTRAEESWLTGRLFAALETKWGLWLAVIIAITAFAVVVYFFRTPSGAPKEKTIEMGPVKMSTIYFPPDTPPDTVDPVALREKAENGDVRAQSLLGVMYYKRQDYAEAVKWWRLAVAQGEAKAAKQKESIGEPTSGERFSVRSSPTRKYSFSARSDEMEADLRRHLSAEQALAAAQHNLGVAYYEGNGVPQSNAEAAKWWHRAAEQGFAESKAALKILQKSG